MEEEKCQNLSVGIVDGLSNGGTSELYVGEETSNTDVGVKPVVQPESILQRIVSPNGKIFNFNDKISKYFTLKEMVICREDWKLRNWENLTMFNYVMLTHLCNTILDPIREQFGAVQVTSGFRYLDYNKFIGGAEYSQHCYGQAADIIIKDVKVLDVVKWVANSTLKFGQVIVEPGWTHISLGEIFTGRTSNYEILEFVDGKYYKLNKNMERV